MCADSARLRPFLELEGLTRGASRLVWKETVIQPQDWSVSNLADLRESTWDFANDALEHAKRRQLGSKLWLAATARDSDTSDMHGRKLAVAQLNPRAAYKLADMITGKFLVTAKLGEAAKKAERNRM